MIGRIPPLAPLIRSKMAAVRALFAQAHTGAQPVRMVWGNTPDSGLSDHDFRRAILALAIFLQTLVWKRWGAGSPALGTPPFAPPIVEALAPGEAPPEPAEGSEEMLIRIRIVASIDDAAGYHVPIGDAGGWDGYVAVDGLDLDGLTEVIGHEGAEALPDPMCDLTVTAPNGDKIPVEVCDAVQAASNADRIPIDLGDGEPPVMMPNFVWPRYFDASTPPGEQVDELGRLPGPLTLGPAGYSAIQKADGSEVNVYGPGSLETRAALPPHLQHPEARIQQRLARMRSAT